MLRYQHTVNYSEGSDATVHAARRCLQEVGIFKTSFSASGTEILSRISVGAIRSYAEI